MSIFVDIFQNISYQGISTYIKITKKCTIIQKYCAFLYKLNIVRIIQHWCDSDSYLQLFAKSSNQIHIVLTSYLNYKLFLEIMLYFCKISKLFQILSNNNTFVFRIYFYFCTNWYNTITMHMSKIISFHYWDFYIYFSQFFYNIILIFFYEL